MRFLHFFQFPLCAASGHRLSSSRVLCAAMWYEEDSSSAAIEAECAKLTPNSGDPATTVSPTSNAVGPKTAETPAYQFIDLPHNFYWAIPGKLIGMGCPTRRRHVENLIQHHKVCLLSSLF